MHSPFPFFNISFISLGLTSGEQKGEKAALYAMLGSTTNRAMAKEFAVQYMNDLYCMK